MPGGKVAEFCAGVGSGPLHARAAVGKTRANPVITSPPRHIDITLQVYKRISVPVTRREFGRTFRSHRFQGLSKNPSQSAERAQDLYLPAVKLDIDVLEMTAEATAGPPGDEGHGPGIASLAN